jgi:hypothetical protein
MLQRAHIGDAVPLSLAVASRCVRERRGARMRASLPQWNRESAWLALNRCISQEEWTRPTDSWIAQGRSHANRGIGSPLRPE